MTNGSSKKLHVLHGGPTNGDRERLEALAKSGGESKPLWVAPKHAAIGDDVVIYVGGYGFFATGQIMSMPKLRLNWKNEVNNRYGASVGSVELIRPPIPLEDIRKSLKTLAWARAPRSIHTPPEEVADHIRRFLKLNGKK